MNKFSWQPINNEFNLIKTNKQCIYSHENQWKINIF